MKKTLLGTLPGRAIVIGLLVRLADLLLGLSLGRVPAFVGAIDTVAAVVIAAAGAYFLARGLSVMRRRLLWRVRRKLIISYIFLGFIPALLLFAFFILGGVLLFSNFSAYLVRSELRTLTSRADSMARIAALEIERAGTRDVEGILRRRQAVASEEFPGVSMAVVDFDHPCTNVDGPSAGATVVALAGPWSHAMAPQSIPAWVACQGFSGLLKSPRLIVRAVAFPESATPDRAVLVDLVVNSNVRQQIRERTGVELVDPSEPASADAPPLTSIAYVEYVDWETGARASLQLSIRLGIGEIYDRISAAPGMDGTRNVVIILLELVGGLFLIIEMVALVAGLSLARSITGSVHELFTGTERVRQGNFTHKIAVTADDQLGELAGSFNLMTASIKDLLLQADEKKRLEEELRIAHEIQMSLLPQGGLRMSGMSVTAISVPAREVGGDYYDFLPLDDQRFGLLIADVSGKGTSAALYMAELKGLVLSLSRIYSSPRELLIQANRLIAEHLDARSFITMTYAVVDLKSGTMTYARAGHTPLIHLPGSRGGPNLARILAPDGLVLGLRIDNGETFERLLEEDTIPLQGSDLYVFFTDGITEAMNERDDLFGEMRLAGLIEQHAHLPLEELRELLLGEIRVFVGAAPQHDDMTIILLKIDDSLSASPAITAERAEVAQV